MVPFFFVMWLMLVVFTTLIGAYTALEAGHSIYYICFFESKEQIRRTQCKMLAFPGQIHAFHIEETAKTRSFLTNTVPLQSLWGCLCTSKGQGRLTGR